MSIPSKCSVIVFILFLLLHTTITKADDKTETLLRVNRLRGIQPTDDENKLKELNAAMDDVWKFAESHKEIAASVLTIELNNALAEKQLDQFFILDVGYLLYHIQGKDAEALAISALEKINPFSKIIRYNFKELFDFTHELAKTGNIRVLPQIDRIFFPSDEALEFFTAPHYVKLDARLICVFLYGVTGSDADLFLAKILNAPGKDKKRALEILQYIGSENTAGEVIEILQNSSDYETFSRALTVLMTVGGPRGRDAVSRLDTNVLDSKSKKYLKGILPEVKKITYNSLLTSLKQFDGSSKTFSGEKLKHQLEKMYDNYGVDDETNPSEIATSDLPTDYLISQLKRIRSRMLFRANTHALDDVMITNEIINTLQFKP